MITRTRIRQRLREVLAAVDSLRDRISFDKQAVPSEEDLPFVFAWIGSEDIDKAGMNHAATVDHVMQLYFDVFSRDSIAAAEGAENIIGAIETALAVDQTLGGLVRSVNPRALTVENEDDGSMAVVRMRLLYEVIYFTRYGSPEISE